MGPLPPTGVAPVRWVPLSLDAKEPPMPTSRIPYPPEFRQQMIELVRSGRSPGSLAKEFEPAAQTIHTWVKQARPR